MNDRPELRNVVATKSFWQGVSHGMRSPAGRRGFKTGYRNAVWPGAVGALLLVEWVKHARAVAGQAPLSSIAELGVCMIGSAAMVIVVTIVTRVWQRWHQSRV
ncbi:MAG TPA: hypothetical protein VIG47_06990 [Gemmatimonadaceae bacterium]